MIVMLVIMIMGTAAFLVSALNSSSIQIERDKKTADTLAQAKEVLISRAITDANLLGSLPCPDQVTNIPGTNVPNDGIADLLVGNDCPSYIGRLPWRTLGLGDLRDGSGERLWYALSRNFRDDNSNRINSDTPGTLNITGTQTAADLAAIVFSPGSTLSGRSRSATQTALCSTTNTTVTESLCATNYLEGNNANPNPNMQYTAVGTNLTNAGSFIPGVNYQIKIIGTTNFTLVGATSNTVGLAFTATGTGTGTGVAIPLNNDQMLMVRQNDIMQPVQKRVAAEVKNCLTEYANDPQNKGRYPWTSRVRDTGTPPSYSDRSGYLFGRIPDSPFRKTCEDSGGNNCDQTTQSGGMWNNWRGRCNISPSSGWWLSWKEMTFYALADAYKPVDPITTPVIGDCSVAGACLHVNPPSVTTDKKFVVIVAGKMLFGQSRSTNTEKGTFNNYLEAPNPTPPYSATPANPTGFSQGTATTMFNDTVVFQ